ncbi:MAG: amidohydrolase [Synergistales bacterium]|nr:amidohydrolase [Synergistales bacterium]
MAQEEHQETIRLRHHFHSHPELSWKEIETSRTVAEMLGDFGYENIRTGAKGTESGVAADLNVGKEGRCVALRADMDALPVQEQNDLPYRSQNDGVMHACGHDSHISMLLTAAKNLARVKDDLPGRVRIIFQPAEEYGIESGADYMTREGVLDGVDAIAGCHIWSPLETGKMAYRYGPTMASCDKWQVNIRGAGGHGAMPHLAVDPTIAASNFVSTLQTVVSREVDPLETVVVSIGSMHAGSAFNVIPEEAEIIGNYRAFDPGRRAALPNISQRILDGICAALRCEGELELTPFVSPVINEKHTTDIVRETGEAMLGAENVEETPLVMVSEDFSFYQEKIPGTFFFVGCRNPGKGTDVAHHHPRFNVDDDALPGGVALLSGFAYNYLTRGQ